MDLRRLTAGSAGVALALVVLVPGVASAAGPPTATPAGTGGGCAANGHTIAGAAQGLTPFGEIVRDAAPIADDNAAFFSSPLICG